MRAKLSVQDKELLLKKTKFSEEDILEWFEAFIKECPEGLLHKERVFEIFEGELKCLKICYIRGLLS